MLILQSRVGHTAKTQTVYALCVMLHTDSDRVDESHQALATVQFDVTTCTKCTLTLAIKYACNVLINAYSYQHC
jgi:hypothetical protein